jgi:hypothetical protein
MSFYREAEFLQNFGDNFPKEALGWFTVFIKKVCEATKQRYWVQSRSGSG